MEIRFKSMRIIKKNSKSHYVKIDYEKENILILNFNIQFFVYL